jgi:hemerythrin-like metal-binding protein
MHQKDEPNLGGYVSYFVWSDELSVGNAFIDSDHQMLVDYINQLHEAMAKGHGKEVLGKILNELIRYAKEHFQREEDHMKSIRYADFPSHKQEHEIFIKEVSDLHAKFSAGNAMLSVRVSKFLKDWLVNHIMKLDRKLAAASKAILF